MRTLLLNDLPAPTLGVVANRDSARMESGDHSYIITSLKARYCVLSDCQFFLKIEISSFYILLYHFNRLCYPNINLTFQFKVPKIRFCTLRAYHNNFIVIYLVHYLYFKVSYYLYLKIYIIKRIKLKYTLNMTRFLYV